MACLVDDRQRRFEPRRALSNVEITGVRLGLGLDLDCERSEFQC